MTATVTKSGKLRATPSWSPAPGMAARLTMRGPWDGSPVTIHGPADHRDEGWNCTIHARDGQDYYIAVHPMNLAPGEADT